MVWSDYTIFNKWKNSRVPHKMERPFEYTVKLSMIIVAKKLAVGLQVSGKRDSGTLKSKGNAPNLWGQGTVDDADSRVELYSLFTDWSRRSWMAADHEHLPENE